MNTHLSPTIRAVFFDWDDTLVHTFIAKWAQHKFVARTYYGKELTDDDIRPHWGKPLGELMRILYGTDDIQQALAVNRSHHQNYPKSLHETTIPTLRHIQAAGIIVGLVTAHVRDGLEHDLEQVGMPVGLFDYTQTSDETAYHKPDPRVFEPTLRWLGDKGIQPNEVLYVGDGLHDAQAALGAGMHFLGVATGLVTEEEFRIAGLPYIPHIGHLIDNEE